MTDEVVINGSLGASPSKLALYEVSALSLGRNDVVILDYTVTEAVFQSDFWNVNAETISKDITSIVDYLDRRGCHVILMLNPDFLSLRGENVFEAIHLECAARLALPILNITELFRRTAKLGGNYRQMMQDNSHAAIISAPVIAQTILLAVADVRKHDLRPALQGEPIWLPRVIPLAPMVPAERRLTLSSRLRTTDMAAMHLGDELHFDVYADEYVLGLVVNMAGRGARIQVISRDVVETRDFIFHWENDNRMAAMAWFAPMRNRIEGSEDGVQLRVVPFGEGEQPPYDIARPLVLDLIYDEVSIEGLLIGRIGSATRNDIVGGHSVDLLALSYQEWAIKIYAATRDAPLCEFSF